MILSSLTAISSVASIVSPLSKALVDAWIAPKLAEIANDGAIEKLVIDHSFENKFTEYITRSFEKQSYVRTVVFQNQQKLLQELYIPLTVRAGDRKDRSEFLIDCYKDDFVSKYKRVLITDTAGMGKSTVSRFLFMTCISENKGVPVFIELRQLSADKTILDVIYNELNPIDDMFSKDFILKLIRRGDFVFFLDGYDEIPFSVRDAVTLHIQDFVSKSGNNDFVLTSRPENALASFANFKHFFIKPLKRDEAFELIRKYDEYGSTSTEIIALLHGKLLNNVSPFLTNPLLTSLLYKAYQFKANVPIRKSSFYHQVYDALFENHDFTKPGSFQREKHSRLDIDDFGRVLRALGFITLRLGKVEYSKDELLSYISDAKKLCPGLEFKPVDFAKDLLTTVPLFLNDGDQDRWSHKSIQEYFSSLFICMDAKERQSKILEKMVDNEQSERYTNVLDLCYDIDYKGFRKSLTYSFISGFIEYCAKHYLRENYPAISEKDLNVRKSLCYGKHLLLLSPTFTKTSDDVTVTSRDLGTVFDRVYAWTLASGLVSKMTPIVDGRLLPDEGGILLLKNNTSLVFDILFQNGESVFHDSSYCRVPPYNASMASDFWANEGLVRDAPILVKDDPDAAINGANLFKDINILLGASLDMQTRPGSVPVLSYEKCLILKKEIEMDLLLEQDIDDFALVN